MDNKCVNCSVRIFGVMFKLVQSLDISARTILTAWVHPFNIADASRICLSCHQVIAGLTMEPGDTPPQRMFGHSHVCFSCGISILKRRSHAVLENTAERDIFLQMIPTYQVPYFTRACHRCWMNVTRQQQRVQDIGLGNVDTDMSQDQLLPIEPSPPEPTNILLPIPATRQQAPKIISRTYKRVATTSRHCLFSDCINTERLLVPNIIKEILLVNYKLYVPHSARICHFHLYGHEWERLETMKELRDFTAFQVDDMLSIMDKHAKHPFNFHDIDGMNDHVCYFYMGLNCNKFNEILLYTPNLKSIELASFLVKLRTGYSNDRIATLFNIPTTTLCKYIHKARNALTSV